MAFGRAFGVYMYTLADAHLYDSKYMALGPVSVYTLANAQGYVSRTHREQMHYPKAMYLLRK